MIRWRWCCVGRGRPLTSSLLLAIHRLKNVQKGKTIAMQSIHRVKQENTRILLTQVEKGRGAKPRCTALGLRR